MSLWGDMCEEHRRYFLYRLGLAGGITSSVRMRCTYFPKQELKFSPPKKRKKRNFFNEKKGEKGEGGWKGEKGQKGEKVKKEKKKRKSEKKKSEKKKRKNANQRKIGKKGGKTEEKRRKKGGKKEKNCKSEKKGKKDGKRKKKKNKNTQQLSVFHAKTRSSVPSAPLNRHYQCTHEFSRVSGHFTHRWAYRHVYRKLNSLVVKISKLVHYQPDF